MRNLDDLFAALAQSAFRRRFRLRSAERRIIADKGLPAILQHARDLLAKRLARATIPNDGKQTPFRGHPVFVAQHATATCCRGCLMKWHGIEKGRAMTEAELDYAVGVIGQWIERQGVSADEHPGPPRPVTEPLLWDNDNSTT